MYKLKILLFSLILLFGACNNIVNENSSQNIDSSASVLDEVNNIETNILISTDSIFQIKIYKTVSKLSSGYYNMKSDSMQYACIELSRIDSGVLALSAYQTLSNSMPENYLTITVQDSNNIAQSEWFLCEHTIYEYKFHFAFDAFEMFGDFCDITIGYPGWHILPEDEYFVEFKTNNFSEIISGLVPSLSDKEKVDNNWFISRGIDGMGLGQKK